MVCIRGHMERQYSELFSSEPTSVYAFLLIEANIEFAILDLISGFSDNLLEGIFQNGSATNV